MLVTDPAMFFRNMRQIKLNLISDTPDFVSGFSFILSHDSIYKLGAGDGIRTHTVGILSPLPLPIALHPHIMVGS